MQAESFSSLKEVRWFLVVNSLKEVRGWNGPWGSQVESNLKEARGWNGSQVESNP